MKNLKNIIILLTPILFLSVSSNAYSMQPNGYNTACLNGGTIEGFTCNPDKLSNSQAHSFCTNQMVSASSNRDTFLDCMGSFLPFTDSEQRTSQDCDMTNTLLNTRGWGDGTNSVYERCRGNMPKQVFKDGESISIANINEGFTGIGHFRCVNGNMRLNSSISICSEIAQNCDLSDIDRSWGATHFAAIGENETRIQEFGFVSQNQTDWNRLSMHRDFQDLQRQNCFVNNMSGEVETYERVLLTPENSNLRDINDTSLYFSSMIIDDVSVDYFGNLPSYNIDYCYNGDISSDRALGFFRETTNALNSAGIIDNKTRDDLLNQKCTVSIPDCRATAVPNFGNDGAKCDFEIPDMRHGSDPLFMTNFINLGSNTNPVFFGSENETHGTARFGCFAGRTIQERANCYLTPQCNNKPNFNNGEVNLYTSRFTVDNPNNALSDREIIQQAIEDRREDFQNQCDNLSIEGVGGSLTSITSDFFERNISAENVEIELKAECSYLEAPTNLCDVGSQTITDAFLVGNDVELYWSCQNGLVDIECDNSPEYAFPEPIDPDETPLFDYEWVIAGAVTEGGRNLEKNDFSRFNDTGEIYSLPDVMTKELVIALDRVRLGKNNGDHSSRGGNATGRAREAFNESGCSVSERRNFEEFSYTRSRSVGSNRHYGVVIAQCPCSASSDIEACVSGTQPNIFAPSSGGGGSGGGGSDGGGDPTMPEIQV